MDNDMIEPIAIIGINLKFPDDATSPQSFWTMLEEKRCSSSEVPPDRFNINAFYHPNPARTDNMKVRRGHFIKENIKAFDAPFFSMSPAEASTLDPQQRHLLEGAFHTFENACQSLLQNESDMSLVAGSNTYFTPECFSIALDNGGFLSPDGISYSFDHRANGYARGEGFGFTLLKPLRTAIRDGDMIRAVVRATGVNQDGRSPTITQPSPAAQIDLIRKTYEKGGLDLATTRYVEAHGTGTPIGDPIEAAAIGEVFRDYRDSNHPLFVGSVKSNIGHLEGASGLAGILKTILILERGCILPNAWTEKVNPAIDTESLHIEFPSTAKPWPNEQLRRASLRGLKGLHQSIDLSESETKVQNTGVSNGLPADRMEATYVESAVREFKGIVVLSAADDEGPTRQTSVLQSYLSSLSEKKLGPEFYLDLLHTLSVRRTHFPHRAFTVSSFRSVTKDLATKLSTVARASRMRNMYFVFTGQVCGHSSGEIAAAFCAGALTREDAWKVAFYRGIVSEKLQVNNGEPMAMMSVGLGKREVLSYLDPSGSVTVGCINSPTNVTLTGTRSQVEKLWAVFDKAQIFVRKLEVDVAYHSKNMNAVAEEYNGLIGHLEGIQAASSEKVSRTSIFSSVTGTRIDPRELSKPSYWVRNLTSTVRFSDALSAMITGGDLKAKIPRQALHIVVEIGPQAALRRPVQDTLNTVLHEDQWLYATAIKANSGDESTLETVGLLWAHGIDVDIDSVNTASAQMVGAPRMLVDLPAYSFNHSKEFWEESRISRNYAFRPFRRHQLLGLRAKDWNPGEASWRHLIRVEENPWIMDHGLNESPLYPGSGMLVMAIEAARQLTTHPTHLITGYRIKDVRFLKAITVNTSEHGSEAQIHLRPRRLVSNSTAATWYDWRIYTLNGDEWTECAYGNIKVEIQSDQDGVRQAGDKCNDASVLQEYRKVAEKCSQSVHHEQMYNNLAKFGFTYGPYFRQLRTVKFDKAGNASATLSLRGFADKMAYADEDPVVIHPTTLDALCHLQMVGLSAGGLKPIPTMIFSHLREIWVSQKLLTAVGNPNLTASTHETMRGFRETEYDTVALFSDTQEPVVIIAGERGTAITSLALSAASASKSSEDMLYTLDFKPDLSLLNKRESLDVLNSLFTRFEAPPKGYIDRADAIALHYVEKALNNPKVSRLSHDRAHLNWYSAWMAKVASNRGKESLYSRGQDNVDIVNVLQDAHLEPSQNLVARVGEKLDQILMGECDPLEVVFNGTLAEEFWHSSIFTSLAQKMGVYVQLLAHQNPHLKILEIGAGSGSATDHILSFLFQTTNAGNTYPRFSEYSYTDISAAFFDKARDRLKNQARYLNFQKLDIDIDPSTQGFTAETYDVILAANVLHVSKDLPRALRYVRRLLRPGGKLILEEVVCESIRDSFVFGLLPGWWSRPNSQHLEQGSLLNEAQWADLLPQCGFSGVDLAFRDHEDDPYHRFSVMVATASDVQPPDAPSSSDSCYILVDESSTHQKAIAVLLRKLLLSMFLTIEIAHISLSRVKDAHLNLKGSTTISLLELEVPTLAEINNEQFNGLKEIAISPKQLLWVTKGGGPVSNNPYGDIAVGLSRVICSEREDQGFKVLNVDSFEDSGKIPDMISRIVSKMVSSANTWDDSEFATKDGILLIPRLTLNPRLSAIMESKIKLPGITAYTVGQSYKPHVTVMIGTPGLLDTVFYQEDAAAALPLEGDDIEIEIKASSLNFKDLMHTLGQIPGNAIGFDGAGIVSRTKPGGEFSIGDRVMWCSSSGGGFGTFVRCSELQVVKIPDDMSFQVAAAIPVVYHTVIYAFMHSTRINKGESVLIHAGAGGVGQAAIQLARVLGAGEIFVTVGSRAKRELVKELYGLPDNRIFSSRDDSFERDIKRETNGRGVDVILNCLGGDLLQRTWDCIAPFGRFIEIGKGDILNNTALPMEPFTRNVSFIAIDIVVVHEQAKHVIKKLLTDFLELRKNHPQLHEPRPLHIFPGSKIEDAMRFLQSGKNTGKTIIDYTVQDDQLQFYPSLKPSYRFDDHATYVISGGLGGLGRNIIRWMVARGAKFILALSRRGSDGHGQALEFVQEVEGMGAHIWAPACDTSNEATLKKTIDICRQRYPPIKGCICGAMVLRDSLFEKMSGDNFQEALRPKVSGSWNLHSLLPRDLDFFVLLSSFSGIAGQRGQSNYAAGNTFEDALSRHRVSQGQKGVSLNIPIVAEAGWAVENYSSVGSTLRNIHTPLTMDQLTTELDIVCNPAYDCTRWGASQLITITDSPQKLVRMSQDGAVDWMGKPLFASVVAMGERGLDADTSSLDITSKLTDYLAMVQAAASTEEAADVILQGLLLKLSKALSVPADSLDVTRPAYVLGVDSLIGVEVRYWFIKNVNVEVAVLDILRDQSLISLCQMVAAQIV
ncbi:KR domain-containing protein [Stemphylium lycopersici]|nr:KR domain-containing protein [Stemphylium lycopersici]